MPGDFSGSEPRNTQNTISHCRCLTDADRLLEVSEVCCGTEDPNSVCPRGAPPRDCPALCAVTFHALIGDCGETLQSVVGRVNAARFAAFDELCTSEQSVDPIVFLDAIANAECTFAEQSP